MLYKYGFTYTIKQKLDLDLGTIELMNKSLFYEFSPFIVAKA